MATLPQLLEEDIQQLDDALRDLLKQSDGTTALVIDKGGEFEPVRARARSGNSYPRSALPARRPVRLVVRNMPRSPGSASSRS